LEKQDKTVSEKLFEEFCARRNVECQPIMPATQSGYRRADYKVRLGTGKAVVEVKQINPNETDLKRAEELNVLGYTPTIGGGTPGERIRRKLRSGSGQLRKFSLRNVPTMVAIFDTTFSVSATEPYNVKTGMYGLDAIVFAVPQDPGISPYTTGVKSGGHQTLTENDNTSISAVAILRKFPEQPVGLYVYHNKFARISFDPGCLTPIVLGQYILAEPDGKSFPDWLEV
jgi:hypothetical protein